MDVIPTWGVLPGKRNRNAPRWDRVRPGAVVLFAADKAIRASGVVVHKLRNEPLAEHLWGRDGKGQTWEFMYLIEQLEECNVPYVQLNAAAGYEADNVVQSFEVLSEDKSNNILAVLPLRQDGSVAGTADDFTQSTAEIDEGPLDTRGTALLRKEQGFIRRQLFRGRPIGSCAICGHELPVDLLVAAHIKRRTWCSLEEKRDFRNNILPMCCLGCDDLFEKGYIFIEGDVVSANPRKRASSFLEQQLAHLKGLRVANVTPGMGTYVDYHRNHHSGG